MLTGDLTGARHRAAQHELGVHARDEAELERPDLVDPVRFDGHRTVGQTVQAHEVGGGGAAEHRAPVAAGDGRGVERVVEVGVPEEDGVGGRHEAVEQGGVGTDDPTAQQIADRRPGDVGVDQDPRAFVGERDSGDAEPGELESGREVEVVRRHRERRRDLAVVTVVAALPPHRPGSPAGCVVSSLATSPEVRAMSLAGMRRYRAVSGQSAGHDRCAWPMAARSPHRDDCRRGSFVQSYLRDVVSHTT